MNNPAELLPPGTPTTGMRGPLLLFLLLLSLLVPVTLRAEDTQQLLFFYSSNVQGEIDPCG